MTLLDTYTHVNLLKDNYTLQILDILVNDFIKTQDYQDFHSDEIFEYFVINKSHVYSIDNQVQDVLIELDDIDFKPFDDLIDPHQIDDEDEDYSDYAWFLDNFIHNDYLFKKYVAKHFFDAFVEVLNTYHLSPSDLLK